MIIQNSLIIINKASAVRMRVDELKNFRGNVVVNRDAVSAEAFEDLVRMKSSNEDSAAADLGRTTMQPELVG
ncbi:hypothetical protein Q3C01_17510 [Bradyrhizobium sp. UFLA05-109]